jgi:hypothetical protein
MALMGELSSPRYCPNRAIVWHQHLPLLVINQSVVIKQLGADGQDPRRDLHVVCDHCPLSGVDEAGLGKSDALGTCIAERLEDVPTPVLPVSITTAGGCHQRERAYLEAPVG